VVADGQVVRRPVASAHRLEYPPAIRSFPRQITGRSARCHQSSS
jgi:hypothetical protein